MSTKHATAEPPVETIRASTSTPEVATPRAPPGRGVRSPSPASVVRILRNFFNPSEEFAGLERLDRDELDDDAGREP